jgi:hypothetical protein
LKSNKLIAPAYTRSIYFYCCYIKSGHCSLLLYRKQFVSVRLRAV